MNIYREGQTGEGWLYIPQYNWSLSICIQNLNFLCYTVVEISLTKIWRERKRKKYREEQTGEGLFSIPRHNLSLSTVYQIWSSILNRFGDIFDEKVLRNYGRTDERKDGRMDRCKPVYPHTFSKRGYNNSTSFMLGSSRSLMQDQPACNWRGKQYY